MANPNLIKVFHYIDVNQDTFVENLRESVSRQSVSSSKENRPATIQQMRDVAKHMEDNLNIRVELADVGCQTMPDGDVIPLPPVILGQIGYNPAKKTVLVYGHLDVQPANMDDGWKYEPFELTEEDGKLYGRGSTDDKGPVLAVLHVVEAYKSLNLELPVNLKFVFEGMEESGSVGLDELLESRKDTFLKDVSCTMISDNYWLGKNKPCLTYGLRYEAMTDLFHLMGSLVNAEGVIQVPGVNEQVAPVTPEEEALYEPIDFNLAEYKEELGAYGLVKKTKAGVLKNRWRFPSLSLHGIQGAFSDAGAKTVIPMKVTGKFSIRLVPDMNVDLTFKLVKKHLKDLQAQRGSPNPINVIMDTGAKSWVADFNHPNFMAGKKATQIVYKQNPDLTREGGSIPVTLTIQETTNQSVILLPIGSSDDAAHSQNEKINRTNYIQGTKLLAAYFEQVAAIDFE